MADLDPKELMRKAATELRSLRSRVAELEQLRTADPTAIVGMSCRLPHADDVGEYWRSMAAGVDGTSEAPAERVGMHQLFDPDPDREGRIYTKRGGFLGAPLQFDAAHFGIAARDAST